MPFYFDDESLSTIQENSFGSLETNFTENYEASLESFKRNDQYFSYENFRDEELDQQFEQARTVGLDIQRNPHLPNSPLPAGVDGRGGTRIREAERIQRQKREYDETVQKLNEENPDLQLKTLAEIEQAVITKARLSREDTDDISSRSSTAGGFGEFVGAGQGAMTDPINIAAMVATAPFAAQGLLAFMATEAAVAGVSEAFIQTKVVPFLIKQGMSEEDAKARAFQTVMTATAAGGVLAGGGKLIARGVGKLAKARKGTSRLDEIIEEAEARIDELPASQKENLRVLREYREFERSAPNKLASQADIDTHVDLLQRATNSIESGKIDPVLMSRADDILQSGSVTDNALPNLLPPDVRDLLIDGVKTAVARTGVDNVDDVVRKELEALGSTKTVDQVLDEAVQPNVKAQSGQIGFDEPQGNLVISAVRTKDGSIFFDGGSTTSKQIAKKFELDEADLEKGFVADGRFFKTKRPAQAAAANAEPPVTVVPPRSPFEAGNAEIPSQASGAASNTTARAAAEQSEEVSKMINDGEYSAAIEQDFKTMIEGNPDRQFVIDIDGEGNPITRSANDISNDLERDNELISQFTNCVLGK